MDTFNQGFEAMPIGWQAWIYWMTLVNTASLLFLKNHISARVVLGVWIVNAGSMMAAAEVVGFTRILGLVHVVYWTPLAIYLFRKITVPEDDEDTGVYKIWVRVLLVTICLSLILDYVDVVRYILGDRG
jgi:hypothetical protein